MPHSEILWWNFNIPSYQQTLKCPDSLVHLSDKDRRLIGSWDSDYDRLTWDEVKEIIAANRIDEFQRVPSDLRRYRQYIYNLQNTHGSVLKYIQNNLLRWPTLDPKGPPFTCPTDVKILYNDWPYGLDERIIHLVVWTKFELEEDERTGDLTDAARNQIQDYVDHTFGSRMDSRDVAWFKNWTSLKSIEAVEHFHVMLFDPDMDFISQITWGHVPMCEQLRPNRLEKVMGY
ncbi:hypothetical protein EG328_007170 [Venturia inaequalis]|uniref:N-acetylglucosamine-induced protein 1 n=1 Tax=Venturia inaequalis TaxID=5025 RepID=A0A8H3YQ05_VENIN|nr:hypothetical protein EG328_007170 [Venturia inaequalis]